MRTVLRAAGCLTLVALAGLGCAAAVDDGAEIPEGTGGSGGIGSSAGGSGGSAAPRAPDAASRPDSSADGTPNASTSATDAAARSDVQDGAGAPSAPNLSEPDRLPAVIPVIWIEVGGRAIGSSTQTVGKLRVIEEHDGSLKDVAALTQAAPTLATPIGISVRGNFTAGLPKKQYALELKDDGGLDRDLPVLGLPPGSDFTLNASYTDHTFMRNPLTYAMGRELGRWASRFRFVEIFIDGKYNGLYILQEKNRRDKHRVDIAKPAADAAMGDITGGYMIRLEGTGKGALRDFKSAGGRLWTYHYPRHLEITPGQRAYLLKYVDDFEAAMKGVDFPDAQKGYRKWIDVASFVDYALVQDFTRNFDSYWKSHYFNKDSDPRGGKLRAGPIWDFDNAYGLAEFARESVGRLQTNIPDFWKRLWEDPAFRVDLKCRWQDQRKPGGVFTLERINAKLDLWDKYIAPARVRDNARWNYLGTKTFPNHLVAPTHEAHVAFMRTWIDQRLKWVDANLPGACNR